MGRLKFRYGCIVLVVFSFLCFKRLMEGSPILRNAKLPSDVRNSYGTEPSLTDMTLHPCGCRRYVKSNSLHNMKPNSIGNSTCSSSATARGPGQRVVSYALYGEITGAYYKGLLKLLPRVKEVYPGWLVRVYTDLSIDENRKWVCTIACENDHLDLCDIKNLPEIGDVRRCGGTVWRFMVVGDPLVERYMIRDTDSPILQREVDAVNEWLRSGKCFHAMRDHPFHYVPMMGGMWGGCNTWKRETFQDIRKNLKLYGIHENADQQLLEMYMWPEVKKNVLMHDSYLCQSFTDSIPFPTKRENFTFIGMSSYKFGVPESGNPCPLECRPPDHKDWEFC